MGMNEDKARLAEEKRAKAEAQRSIRVLCVGGVLDGQWKVLSWDQRHSFDVMRPVNLVQMMSQEQALDRASIGFPEMDRYRVMGPIHMYGSKGITVALDRDTLMEKFHGDEERMMLKAILQRDVATEMGL